MSEPPPMPADYLYPAAELYPTLAAKTKTRRGWGNRW